MQNKNTIFIILLVIIILILGYVAFFRPQNVNQNYGNDNQIPVTNTVENNTVQNPAQNNLPVNTNNPVSISTTLPQYISGQQGWPPVVQTSGSHYSCTPAHSEMGDTVEKIINNKNYCITSFIDAAAGNRYGTYTYTTAGIQGSLKTTTFTLHWPSCGGYGGPGDPTYNQCNTNQTNFFAGLDSLIDSLM